MSPSEHTVEQAVEMWKIKMARGHPEEAKNPQRIEQVRRSYTLDPVLREEIFSDDWQCCR